MGEAGPDRPKADFPVCFDADEPSRNGCARGTYVNELIDQRGEIFGTYGSVCEYGARGAFPSCRKCVREYAGVRRFLSAGPRDSSVNQSSYTFM